MPAMMKSLRRQTLQIWIAMLAVLFSALAPSISHALTPSAPYGYADICSTDKAKKAPAPPMHGMEHCPYCATHGAAPALLPPTATSLAVIGGHDFYPPLFYSAPHPLHNWTAAHPRGPPAVF
jgi:hypothetical protein